MGQFVWIVENMYIIAFVTINLKNNKMKQLRYNMDGNNWVDVFSITPINKVNSYYDGLNIIIQNETKYVILFINSRGILISDEISESDFKRDIKLKEND